MILDLHFVLSFLCILPVLYYDLDPLLYKLSAVSHRHLDDLHIVINLSSPFISSLLHFTLFSSAHTRYKMYPLPPQLQLQAQAQDTVVVHPQPLPQSQPQTQSQIQNNQNANANANANPTKARPSASCIPCRNRKVKVPPSLPHNIFILNLYAPRMEQDIANHNLNSSGLIQNSAIA